MGAAFAHVRVAAPLDVDTGLIRQKSSMPVFTVTVHPIIRCVHCPVEHNIVVAIIKAYWAGYRQNS